VRANDWAGQSGELHDGVSCLVAPVRSPAGELVAGVAVSSARGAVPVESLPAARSCAGDLVGLLT